MWDAKVEKEMFILLASFSVHETNICGHLLKADENISYHTICYFDVRNAYLYQDCSPDATFACKLVDSLV